MALVHGLIYATSSQPVKFSFFSLQVKLLSSFARIVIGLHLNLSTSFETLQFASFIFSTLWTNKLKHRRDIYWPNILWPLNPFHSPSQNDKQLCISTAHEIDAANYKHLWYKCFYLALTLSIFIFFQKMFFFLLWQ